jgi:ribosomal protein L12E/L44/L45/RPP1/RPP2
MNRLVSGALGIAVALGVSVSAHAANDVMKECGAKYQAAKANNTLGGKNWAQFLAACRGTQTAAPAAPAAPAPAAKPVAAAKPASHLPGAQSPAMQAMHDRQRKCGQMWSADKAAGKIPAGQKWPQYWSACNTKLKG